MFLYFIMHFWMEVELWYKVGCVFIEILAQKIDAPWVIKIHKKKLRFNIDTFNLWNVQKLSRIHILDWIKNKFWKIINLMKTFDVHFKIFETLLLGHKLANFLVFLFVPWLQHSLVDYLVVFYWKSLELDSLHSAFLPHQLLVKINNFLWILKLKIHVSQKISTSFFKTVVWLECIFHSILLWRQQ